AGHDVPDGEHGRERPIGPIWPFAVERRHLGGHPDAAGADVVSQHLADHALAVPGAVRQRGIEERDALVDGGAQRLTCLAVVDAAPHVAAEPPAAVADLADGVAGRTERSKFHRHSSHGRALTMASARQTGHLRSRAESRTFGAWEKARSRS